PTTLDAITDPQQSALPHALSTHIATTPQSKNLTDTMRTTPSETTVRTEPSGGSSTATEVFGGKAF
ncbi:MAG: hypothetical protein JJT94_13675, partial [Bernardetiaceae bacterium]|nr:hypothetical protein [Bernardetiaceae bacterium]